MRKIYIGVQLRELRLAAGLTQAELADKAKLARTDVNRIENDAISVGRQRLERLAAALGVTASELAPEAGGGPQSSRLEARLEELARAVGQSLENQETAMAALGEIRAMCAQILEDEQDVPKRSRRR